MSDGTRRTDEPAALSYPALFELSIRPITDAELAAEIGFALAEIDRLRAVVDLVAWGE
jgi:hypothetical protein